MFFSPCRLSLPSHLPLPHFLSSPFLSLSSSISLFSSHFSPFFIFSFSRHLALPSNPSLPFPFSHLSCFPSLSSLCRLLMSSRSQLRSGAGRGRGHDERGRQPDAGAVLQTPERVRGDHRSVWLRDRRHALLRFLQGGDQVGRRSSRGANSKGDTNTSCNRSKYVRCMKSL